MYTIRGIYNGEIVFEDIAAVILKRAGTTESILVNADLPVGTKITVSQVYSGASYKLISPEIVELIASEDIDTLEFQFTSQYNDSNKVNGIVNASDDLVIAGLNNNYRIETCAAGDSSGEPDGVDIQQNQEKTANGANISIKNISAVQKCFVRIKIFCLDDLAYSVKTEGETNELWKLGEGGYWYYNLPLDAEVTTKSLTIQKNKNYKIIVVSEGVPVFYDEDGAAFADWNVKYE